MKARMIFFIFGLISSPVAHAELQNVLSSGVYGQALVFVNPPQPSMRMSETGYKLASQIGYMSLVEEGASAAESVEMRGLDLSLLYHQHLSQSWGVYGLVSTAEHKGDISGVNLASQQVLASDLKSQLTLLGFGSTYSIFENEQWAVPISFGPTYAFGTLSSRIREFTGSGTLADDFDLSSDLQYFGVLAGIQVAYHFNPQFSLVPYAMIHAPLTSQSRCQSFQASNRRVAGSTFNDERSSCASGSAGATEREFEVDLFSHSVGLNFAFPGVGLTVGLFAKAKDHPLLSQASPQHYGLAFAFGSL